MPQNSDPGVISQTLYHQLKGPRYGHTESRGKNKWAKVNHGWLRLSSCNGFQWEENEGRDLEMCRRTTGRCRSHQGKQARVALVSLILTFLMSSEVIGFPFLSIAPSATMIMLRREPRVLVWPRTKRKVVRE
jgi:hypothetical protein